jgi:hypothetical protein
VRNVRHWQEKCWFRRVEEVRFWYADLLLLNIEHRFQIKRLNGNQVLESLSPVSPQLNPTPGKSTLVLSHPPSSTLGSDSAWSLESHSNRPILMCQGIELTNCDVLLWQLAHFYGLKCEKHQALTRQLLVSYGRRGALSEWRSAIPFNIEPRFQIKRLNGNQCTGYTCALPLCVVVSPCPPLSLSSSLRPVTVCVCSRLTLSTSLSLSVVA